MAAAAGQPGDNGVSSSRVVGIHFFNPVPQMKLVEIIPAIQTSSEVLARARAFGSACGKGESAAKWWGGLDSLGDCHITTVSVNLQRAAD